MRDQSRPWPPTSMRYSAQSYLQCKLTKKLTSLPGVAKFNTRQEWGVWRHWFVESLGRILPIWSMDTDDKAFSVARVLLGGDVLLESVDVALEDGFFVPVHVYWPQDQGVWPAVLVCPGFGQRKNADDVVRMCIALAQRGLVAVAVEYDGTGERGDRPDFETDINNVTALGALQAINNVGLRVMTNLAIIDYLKEHACIDAKRIGITGLCQGAIVCWFTAAVCDHISAVAPVCGVTTYQAIAFEYMNRQGGWSGLSPYVFDLLSYGDVQHVLAAVAPRPLFVQNNMTDIHWPLSGFFQVQEFVQHVYGLYDAQSACLFRLEHGPHAFGEPFLTNIAKWLEEVL